MDWMGWVGNLCVGWFYEHCFAVLKRKDWKEYQVPDPEGGSECRGNERIRAKKIISWKSPAILENQKFWQTTWKTIWMYTKQVTYLVYIFWAKSTLSNCCGGGDVTWVIGSPSYSACHISHPLLFLSTEDIYKYHLHLPTTQTGVHLAKLGLGF